jgi:hypothetical protein
MDEVYTELFEKDHQVSVLQQSNYELLQQNEHMKNTIETLVKVKCKRGECNIHLNIDLISCIIETRTILNIIELDRTFQTIKKEKDLVSFFILSLLVGDSKKHVPCVMLDAQTVLFMRNGIYNASTIEGFSKIVHDSIQDQVHSMTKDFETHDVEHVNELVNALNIFMNFDAFVECMRKSLKQYQNL